MKKTIAIVLSFAFVLLAIGYTPTAKAQTATGTLTVIKHVINDSGGSKTAQNFIIRVDRALASLQEFNGSEAGTTVAITDGSYQVQEVNAAGYRVSFSADCTGVMVAGQSKTCVVTNDDLAPGEVLGANTGLPGMPTTGFDPK
jgi:hypothetical protein